jgi:hypothetical protein
MNPDVDDKSDFMDIEPGQSKYASRPAKLYSRYKTAGDVIDGPEKLSEDSDL